MTFAPVPSTIFLIQINVHRDALETSVALHLPNEKHIHSLVHLVHGLQKLDLQYHLNHIYVQHTMYFLM